MKTRVYGAVRILERSVAFSDHTDTERFKPAEMNDDLLVTSTAHADLVWESFKCNPTMRKPAASRRALSFNM